MKNKIAILLLASTIAAPAFADTKIKLSDYKTVAVQPVLAASDSRGLFESQMAASASGLSIKAESTTAAKKLSSAYLDGNQGFGFAGKAQGLDVALLMLGDTIGMLPMMLKVDPTKTKQQAGQLLAIVGKIEGKVDANVTKALTIAAQAAQSGDFETTTKALLVGMALSAEAIKKGSERAHGYMAVGLYVGLATLFVASGSQNQTMADLGAPLVMYLEQDAALGGADRAVAAQLKIVIGELGKSSPELAKMGSVIDALNAVKPD